MVFIILELLKKPGSLQLYETICANGLMTNGNNDKNSYAKEAVLPTVATLEAKNFKVKYDFLNFSQGTCTLKCMQTMTLMIICVSVLKFEIEIL